jgi:hypothetical protein
MNNQRILYDRKTAAMQLSLSPRSLDYLIARRVFPNVRRVGSKVLIPHSDLVRFCAQKLRWLDPGYAREEDW